MNQRAFAFELKKNHGEMQIKFDGMLNDAMEWFLITKLIGIFDVKETELLPIEPKADLASIKTKDKLGSFLHNFCNLDK